MTILEFTDGLYPPSIAAEEKKKLKDGLTSELLFQNFEDMSEAERTRLFDFIFDKMPRFATLFKSTMQSARN